MALLFLFVCLFVFRFQRLNEQAEIAISAAAKLELAAAEMAAAASDLVIAEKTAAQSAVRHAEIAAERQRTILENEEAERTIIILKGNCIHIYIYIC